MRGSRRIPIDVGYAKKMIGEDNVIAMAYKMNCSDNTTRQMMQKGKASIEIIHAFCVAYGADSMKLIQRPNALAEKPKEETPDLTALMDMVKNLANDQATLTAKLITEIHVLSDKLTEFAEAQKEYGEHAKRYHACTYKTLKEFKEKMD